MEMQVTELRDFCLLFAVESSILLGTVFCRMSVVMNFVFGGHLRPKPLCFFICLVMCCVLRRHYFI